MPLLSFFSNRLIILKETIYLNFLLVTVPCINFLSGIVTDLYAPSLPAIANHFHTSAIIAQNTISIELMGFAIGSLLCGILFDVYGRKKIVQNSLFLFTLASLLAPFCQTIFQLLLLRFLQGASTSAMSVGCRAIIADHFTGQKFVVALLYASFAYAIGPVVAPFIGGYLQHYFGWQASFYSFALCACLLLILFILFIDERHKKLDNFTVTQALSFYKTIATHKAFLLGAILFGFIQFELTVFPTTGPFIVEHHLNYSAIVYGNCALFVGLGYLSGTVVNRSLLSLFSQNKLVAIGFVVTWIALVLQLIFSLLIGLNLWTLVLPILLIGCGSGFIYGNILSKYLRIFPNNIGATTSLMLFMLTLFASLGVIAISNIKITNVLQLFAIFFIAIFLQTLIYLYLIRKKLI